MISRSVLGFLMPVMVILHSGLACGHDGPPVSPQACDVALPEAAAEFGLTRPTICETFATLDHVDLGNSKAPGYALYVEHVGSIGTVVFPRGGIGHDGTGVVLDADGWLQGAVRTAVGKHNRYVGTTVCKKGCFAQIDMKFDPRLSPRQAKWFWPAFWLQDIRTITDYHGNPSGSFSGMELDVIEAMPFGMPGQPDLQASIHDQTGYQQDYHRDNSCKTSYAESTVRDAGYHTYSLLYLPPSQNGGIGVFRAWVDGRQMLSHTFSADTAPIPRCPGGLGQPNVKGAFVDLDGAEAFVYLKSAAGWPVGYRNMVVWEKP